VYDARDKLVEVQSAPDLTSSSTSILGRFQYDFEGRRTKKIGEEGLRQYVYDQTSLLAEFDASGLLRAKYDYGSDRLISLTRTDEGRRYFSLDGLRSVVNLTDDSGSTVASYHIDAWGNFRFPNELITSRNRFAFTGHIYDDETGLYNAKARYFDPKLGRFLTQDSFLGEIDAPPSLHRYLYANDNPTRFVDPTGHAAKDGQTSACPQGSTCISPAAEPSTGSLVRGGLAYGVETTAEFLSPMPLGLSDPDTSIHPLANNTASSSWLTGDNQISADYAAFKERYGRGAQVVEGAAVAKYGGKVGKVIGATMIVGAMLYGKPEVNGTQGEEGNFGPEKGDREPLPADKDPARQNAGGTQAQYRGGPHEETKLPTGDTLDSHHMPARSISPLDAEKGPAIKMEREEHRLTSSYGSGPGAVEYRAKIKEMIDKGEWRQALATEIRDVRRVAGAKYNQAIKEMLEYARTLKETGLLKKVAK
jgi:RHS repeat-associated protein